MKTDRLIILTLTVLVIALLSLAYYSVLIAPKSLPITQQVILSSTDFPSDTAWQSTCAGAADNNMDSLYQDAATSVFSTGKDGYNIVVAVSVYLFDSPKYNARQFYLDQTTNLGDSLFGVDNWTRVTPNIGEGCTYLYHLYPGYSQGPDSVVPDRTNFYVILYKGNFSAVMSIDYRPVSEPNIYSQDYIEHIMQMQADKLE